MSRWSLSTRLLLAIVLAAGVPFVAFTFFVVAYVESSITEANAEFFLRNKTADVVDKIDAKLKERRRDSQLWSLDPLSIEIVKLVNEFTNSRNAILNGSMPVDFGDLRSLPDREAAVHNMKVELETKKAVLRRKLDEYCQSKVDYRLLVIFDLSGVVIAHNDREANGEPISRVTRDRLAGEDAFDHPNLGPRFAELCNAEPGSAVAVGIDWHRDRLLVEDVSIPSNDPRDYSVGFAAPIRESSGGKPIGVWFSLMDWSAIQVNILDPVESNLRRTQPYESKAYETGYAFLWDSNAERIYGHPNKSLYGESLENLRLGELQENVRRSLASEEGARRHSVRYEYENKSKRAAFQRTLSPAEGGFGWIVGVGVEDERIFAPARLVRAIMGVALFVGIAGLLLCVFWVSRTVSRPLRDLLGEVRHVAAGNLDARVEPAGPAETAELANAFNQMAADLLRSRENLIRLEKEGAWREMARQVSHEIKNPLTPMKLSVQMVERAWNDRSPEFESILRRALASVDQQIESLRKIASDFRNFAGVAQRNRAPHRAGELLDAAAELYSGAAAEKKLTFVRAPGDGEILCDPDELRRVFVNLIDNAVQAAPPGTAIRLAVERKNELVAISVADEGPGIPSDIREKLFTPYFSTRTHGTGLGLAIVRRIVEDHGGRAYLDETQQKGTRVVVEFPAA